MYYTDQAAISCSQTGVKLQSGSLAAFQNIIGVKGVLMNFAHNVKNAFVSALQVKAFFSGQAVDMTEADVFNAGHSLGLIFFYLVVDSIYANGVPTDPFDTLFAHS